MKNKREEKNLAAAPTPAMKHSGFFFGGKKRSAITYTAIKYSISIVQYFQTRFGLLVWLVKKMENVFFVFIKAPFFLVEHWANKQTKNKMRVFVYCCDLSCKCVNLSVRY